MRTAEVQATAGNELLFRGRKARAIGSLLFEADNGSLIVFREDAAGRITELLENQDVYERVTAEEVAAYKEASRRQSVKLDREILELYAGRYEGQEGVVTIVAAQDGLEVRIPGRGTMLFQASDDHTFFLEGDPVTLEFVTEGGRQVRRGMIVAGGDIIDLVRVKQE